MQLTIIANPENRRCQYMIAAAKNQGLATPFVIAYEDWLKGKVDLASTLAKTDLLKIDSFGENWAVTQGLIALGAGHPALGTASQIKAATALRLAPQKGQIRYVKQLHLGYRTLLAQLEQQLAVYPRVSVLNSPASIGLMFDKSACHQHFKAQGIAVPDAIYGIQSYADFRTKIAAKNWKNVFIKPCYSSSASGVIAFRYSGNKVKAISSAKLVQHRGRYNIYNSLKLSSYTSEKDIAKLIDMLAKEDIIVEQWIPKASLDGAVFDLRMVVIGGKARHAVIRQSQSPLTNLHLGNQRGNLANLQTHLGPKGWQELVAFAEQAAQSIKEANCIGLDIMINANWKKKYVIEANAFGDLLPNVLSNGLDTYQTEVKWLNK